MAKIFGPRKRRTRQHVIADQGVHHVEGFIIDEGHTAEELYRDYGYDLVMVTFDEHGYVEGGLIFLQIKSSEAMREIDGAFRFDMDLRDYNRWISEQVPVILVLFDSSRKHAYWLDVQHYFLEDASRRPEKGAKTVRVKVPSEQKVNRRAVAKWRSLKQLAIV